LATIRPFKAVRPSRDKVALVSSKSFEAYAKEELEAKLDFNPFTFLHVINPGYKFQQEVSGEQRFKLVHNRYLEFKENKIFVEDEKPSFYVYECSTDKNTYCGIIAGASAADYEANIIKKHEGTIAKRVALFENYLNIAGFNAEPVLITYKDDEELQGIIENKKTERAEYEFSTTDKLLHRLWIVDDEATISKIQEIFASKEALYIADGHHRTASSALLAKNLSRNKSDNSPEAAHKFFMSYFIPESHLNIDAFNRFVTDLNGLTTEEFLMRLDTCFRIEKRGQLFYKPSKKHHFGMYLDGEFYSLYLRKKQYKFSDQLSKLDSEILYRTVLNPILGIEDLTHNDRIGYTHNTLDNLSIKTLVDKGRYKIGFSLVPATVKQLKAIADANLQMPPKTTYIRPKLRSGLTMYEF
tara:strand:- start:76339 stop:77574 length:1236 start_codon:yes stop_codon:yes gene_type:complete